MDPVTVPWAALAALGTAVVAIITALWATYRSKDAELKEWIDRWAREVRRYPEDSDFEEKTDVRSLRDRILQTPGARRETIRELLEEYVKGRSDPPKR